MKIEEKDILTLKEFAEYIQVHPNTVKKMIKSNYLAAFKAGIGKTSAFRIARSEATRMSLMNFNLKDN